MASIMSSVLPALVLVLASYACKVCAFTWEPCDADVVPFIPSKVDLTPDPPIIGDSVMFNIQGNAVHDVQSGVISINVTFAGTQIYEEVDDLCSKTSCPIHTGPIDIKYLQELPPIAPPGEYDVQVVAHSLENEELMCVIVHFELVLPEDAHASRASASSQPLVLQTALLEKQTVVSSRKLL